MLAIGMSRPLAIKDVEFNTPALAIKDFEFDGRAGEKFMLNYSPKFMAEIFIKFSELCRMIGAVVNLHFSMVSTDNSPLLAKDSTVNTSMMLFARAQAPDSTWCANRTTS